MPTRNFDSLDRLLIKIVLETTIDQLAIVGGTLPGKGGKKSKQLRQEYDDPQFVHPNLSEKPLEEMLLKERKLYQVRDIFRHFSENFHVQLQ